MAQTVFIYKHRTTSEFNLKMPQSPITHYPVAPRERDTRPQANFIYSHCIQVILNNFRPMEISNKVKYNEIRMVHCIH